jgi:mRNA interferase HigB
VGECQLTNGDHRAVFNIKGNDYRLIVAIDYGRKVVFVKWVGTHAAYDKIDARTVQYANQADSN